MNKKLVFTLVAFAVLAGVLGYWLMQNSTGDGLGVGSKTVILQDGDDYSSANTAPVRSSPWVVAGLGLGLVASVPIASKILNHHSKKQLKQNKQV